MERTITVNGEPQPYQEQTVAELLQAREIPPDRPGIAVAVNATVIPRSRWHEHRLQPGDRVEIVRAVAGGR
ncbi:sulfur carrier protein ThiS [Litorilinea aerophila]|uniref:Sulfur carrier protein ThiS n=1 Tax=Litorilinea aerophila TaxID=1204385 RepID=A0A540VG82_9CHLR|nr:sulfur carrier protein ThiS [Litorilinea aerophila]MCC9076697.1 sulfur carrier protein ThiS [Litorilinea aerophila]OUC05451.1 thiamine biosynthesis protein ThiS [Litorilinea aerophila]GIV77743.1 MAG: thiamine biosynthesis protein ThiS [Litorilinea sp.]